MYKYISLLLLPITLLAQSGLSVITPWEGSAPTTVNYYVATTGNNSNPCTLSSKCLTVAHALSLVPRVLDRPYTINVADGVYTEGFSIVGFSNSYTNSLNIVGNSSTPTNVVFNGTVTCVYTDDTGSYVTGVCVNEFVHITGVTITVTSPRSVFVFGGGDLVFNNVVVNGAASAYSVESSYGGKIEYLGTFTLSGFTSVGLYANLGGSHVMYGGSMTITGPGMGSNTCIYLQSNTLFEIHTGTTSSLTISACQTGIYALNHSTFVSRITNTAISITNSSAPASSTAVFLEGESDFWTNVTGVTMSNFTNCLNASSLSMIVIKSTVQSGCGGDLTTSGGLIVKNF